MTVDVPWVSCTIGALGHVVLSAPLVEAILDAATETGFAPHKWGARDGAVRLPFDRASVSEAVAGGAASVYFKRPSAPKYDSYITTRRAPFVKLELGDRAVSSVAAMFDLAERWSSLEFADYLVCGGTPSVYRDGTKDYRLETNLDRALVGLRLSGLAAPANYTPNGPRGLGVRTYLGPHYVAQFGLDLLESTPASVRRLGKGVLIDLAEKEAWTLSGEELAERWEGAMAHLRPAGIFATPNESFTKWARGPRTQMAYAPTP